MANEHFYPEIEPYRTGELRVDDLHTLYYEECGTPDGLPILFVHGGPGAGCTTTGRRFFDPDRFRSLVLRGIWMLRDEEIHWWLYEMGKIQPELWRRLDREDRLRSIPAFAVHGRYDLVCPVKNLDDLSRAWPELDAVIVPDAGHSSHEPGITRELVAATARIAETGSPVRG